MYILPYHHIYPHRSSTIVVTSTWLVCSYGIGFQVSAAKFDTSVAGGEVEPDSTLKREYLVLDDDGTKTRAASYLGQIIDYLMIYCCRYFRAGRFLTCMIYVLIAHVTGWAPYNMHDL